MKNVGMLFVLALIAIGFPAAAIAQTNQNTPRATRSWLTVETIMDDPAWMGRSPSQVFWSEDGQWVYFNWRREGDAGDSLYVVSAKGGEPRRVSLEERRNLPPRSGSYTRDRKRKVYVRDGDIFLLDIPRGRRVPLTHTVALETNPTFTHDEKKVVFERENNLFLRHLETGEERQITNVRSGSAPREQQKTELQKFLEQQQFELFEVLRKRKGERDARRALQEALRAKLPKPYYVGQKSISQLTLSPDERYVTFVLTQTPTDPRRTIVPNYVTESGFTEDINARTKVGEPLPTHEFFVYDVELDSVRQVKHDDIPGTSSTDSEKAKPRARGVAFQGPYWSDDGTKAFLQLYSQDNKDRWLVMLDVAGARFGVVLDYQHDEAWIGGPGIRSFDAEGNVGWMPDSRFIWFQSEADGYSHLYTVADDGKTRVQLTKGTFEVYDPVLARNKTRWYFHSNEVHFGERHFYSMPLNGGPRTRITSMEGRSDVTLSPDESRAAILYSFSNKMPELYMMDNKPGAKGVRITSSPSVTFVSYDWRAPEVLRFPARDGAQVPARLYKPDRPNGAAVIFVHGAGYLQNAHKWWSTYFREYMFHNLLADKGYMVLDIDYRASAGLGRHWRTAIYRSMGGKDLDDHVDGAKWLVEQHGIDPKRIGIYGGSYGGFITLMAMFTQPDVFAAGAALRPVTDWAHYNQRYTSNILNIPQEDTVAYRRSSPIYHAEGLKGALLMCHGMVDVNVHFQDVVRLAQRLIELRKENWELAVYPVEDHGFVEPTSWIDQYKRVLKLFETHLH